MGKRFRITLCILVGVIGGVVLWKAARPSTAEPVYQGKTLSAWLEGHAAFNPSYNSPQWMKADDALRRIGTNAIPTLLKMIRAKDPPPAMLKLLQFAQSKRLIRSRYRSAFLRNEEAEYAFQALGTNAAAAVPGLIKIYQERVSPSSQRCAAQALGSIHRAATAAIPVLLKDFTHTNGDLRFYAVSAVMDIGGDPNVVVPALKSRLKDPKVEVRWNAAGALGRFGGKARSAVPELLEALNDPAKSGAYALKDEVETALWRIAPEKIAKSLLVEEAAPAIVDGTMTEALDIMFKGERNTLIKAGTPTPCVAQFWSSDPRSPLSLYRGPSRATGKDQFLGRFEVLGVSPPRSDVNVSVLCVIVGQQIFLCARDNTQPVFLEIRRMEDGVAK